MENNEMDFLEILKDVLRGFQFSTLTARALRFFLRNPYESLVIVDKEGKLEFMDRGSERLFGLSEGAAQGMSIMELIPDSALPGVLETGVPTIGRIFNVKGARRIGSTYPLIKDGEIIGALGHLILRSLEEMERINKKMSSLKREVKSLRVRQADRHRAFYTFDNILGISASIKNVRETAKKIATVDTDILITGPSGTGKELFAQAIHNFINPDKPFVWVNCPAIPFELAESELFGYEKGAFTGASTTGKQGKFQLAHNGTLFLDEIGSLPLSIQAKLLRVLQERVVERLGSTGVQSIHFRMIASTNVDLKLLVNEGKFREDLYYRIAKAALNITSLKERKEDIPIYVNYYLRTINERYGTHFKRLSNEALASFINYDWPGNVREIINVLEQASLKKWEGEEIPLSCLPADLTFSSSLRSASVSKGFKKELEDAEKELILHALEKTGGNKRRATFLLGMPRSTLYKKLKEYGIGT